MSTVVLDNGAYAAKYGLNTDKEPKVVPNCVIKAKTVRNRIFVADEVEECKDLSGLYYLLAFQKGYLVNWEIQRQVWDHIFGKRMPKLNFTNSSVIVTEPIFNFSSVKDGMNEVFFEEYDFKSVLRCNASFLSQFKAQKEMNQICSLIVDSGYSFTHIIPYYKGEKVKEGLKRINVGGKVLTNHLKEVISYRQLMVMDETYVINQVKEDTCYVSTDFNNDMKIALHKGKENTIMRDYVLPDYTDVKRGYVKQVGETSQSKGTQQIIRLNNERFAIPEALFHPSDIGIHEMGIAESIVHAIDCLPEEMRPHMYGNIVVTGGNATLPGFRDRLYKDVRAMASDEYDINMVCSNNPVTYAWEGGKILSSDPEFAKLCVTKQQYEEYGASICEEKFDI